MEDLFKSTVQLPRPMTGNQIKDALWESGPDNFHWGLPENDGELVIGVGIQYANYGVELFANEDGVRLLEEGVYSQIVFRNNEGFSTIIHAILDGDGHAQEVHDYCTKVVQDFLASLTG